MAAGGRKQDQAPGDAGGESPGRLLRRLEAVRSRSSASVRFHTVSLKGRSTNTFWKDNLPGDPGGESPARLLKRLEVAKTILHC